LAETRSDREEDHISLLDVAILLAKHKKAVLGSPVAAGCIALIIALALPPTYRATARILPPQQKESSAAAMLGVLVGGATTLGGSATQALGLRNPNELYAGILRGQTIADRLIERFKLKELYDVDSVVNARKALADNTHIIAGKDGLISIDVEDHDPRRAADMANGYVEELDRLMQGLAVGEAAQRRLFFEKQLAAAQNKLIDAEAALRQAIEQKGIAGVDAQTRAVVSTTEQLRAQIAVKEIQLDAMRSFATERHPDAVRLRQEIGSMKSELANLESGRGGTNVQSPTGLENLRKLRDVKFLEFAVELLTKQYEVARIDEAKDAILIQVVDKATAPDYRSEPRRGLVVALTVAAFAILGVLWAFFAEALERAIENPGAGTRLRALRNSLRWW
jgi:uncharacterized protein involved in exopolysaccharide biosynthesis